MLSKAQSKELHIDATAVVRTRMTPLQRGMLLWATTDPGDKVLEVGIRNGALLNRLCMDCECEVCGVSDSMEAVRIARSEVQSADILYAMPQDIPWHDGSIDTVFLCREPKSDALEPLMMQEILRVLKPGGQLVLGAVAYPLPMRQLLNLVTADEDGLHSERYVGSQQHMAALEQHGFTQVSWHQIDLRNGVAIGWKPNAENA